MTGLKKPLSEITISLPTCALKTSDLKKSGYPVINAGRTIYGYYDNYNNEGNAFTVASRGETGIVHYMPSKFWAGALCYAYRAINEYDTRYIAYYMDYTHEIIKKSF